MLLWRTGGRTRKMTVTTGECGSQFIDIFNQKGWREWELTMSLKISRIVKILEKRRDGRVGGN